MLIISGSNVKKTKEQSQSLEIAHKAAKALKGSADCEVIDLRDYKLKPCIMCEKCVGSGKCVKKDDFNGLAAKIYKHRDIMIVCPHYAGVPSKVWMLLEKLQEISYLSYCAQKKDVPMLSGGKAVIIAHGGMIENYAKLYQQNLITPLRNALKAMGMTVLNDTIEEPLCFGVKKYLTVRDKKSVCFAKENDTDGMTRIVTLAVDAFKKAKA